MRAFEVEHTDHAEIANKGSHALRRFMISAARSGGARKDTLEAITHNARGTMIDVYTSWEWPALCEAVKCTSARRSNGTKKADNTETPYSLGHASPAGFLENAEEASKAPEPLGVRFPPPPPF